MFLGLGDKLPFIDIGAEVNISDVVIGASSYTSTCLYVMSVGKVKCWGSNEYGKLVIAQGTVCTYRSYIQRLLSTSYKTADDERPATREP